MTLRIMDEATKKALAGLLPLSPGAFVERTLPCFLHLPEANQPIFRLRDLNAEQFYAMRAAVRLGPVDYETMVKALEGGACGGWDNLPDSAFNEIPFSVDAIRKLPFRWVESLYWICAGLCEPDKLEREVLGLQPQPTSDISSSPAASADVAQA